MIEAATEGDDERAALPLLANGAAALGFPLSSGQIQQFARYSELLLEWNQRINLTAITDPFDIQVRHFLDSLSCAAATGNLNSRHLIDVGSGAGFPGIPLKLLYEELNLSLVESASKKAGFLQAVVSELDLHDVQIIVDRVETIGQSPAFRARFDWAVARGLARMPVLAEYLLPLCRVGGSMLAQKGRRAPEETADAAAAFRRLGGGSPKLFRVKLPGREHLHYLVVVEKIADTPPKYPRRVGVPSKRPLESTPEMEKRIQKASEIILENEQLTADMDDVSAGQLLDWALEWAEHIARATNKQDDSAADELISAKLRSVRRLMRTINRWFRDQQYLGFEGGYELLEKVIEQATIVHGPEYVPPTPARRAAFIQSTMEAVEAERIIPQFRELIEGLGESNISDAKGSHG